MWKDQNPEKKEQTMGDIPNGQFIHSEQTVLMQAPTFKHECFCQRKFQLLVVYVDSSEL